jgi:hypothetical protein
LRLLAYHDMTGRIFQSPHPGYWKRHISIVLIDVQAGDLLPPPVAAALRMVEGMTYKGIHPQATVIEGDYPHCVKLDKESMKPYEE